MARGIHSQSVADKGSTTRRTLEGLEGILAVEEQHADELAAHRTVGKARAPAGETPTSSSVLPRSSSFLPGGNFR